MSKLRLLSSSQLLKILYTLEFRIISQRGSHIKLMRILNNKKQIIIIPNHKQLTKGTTKEIFNQLCNFEPREVLYKLFYT